MTLDDFFTLTEMNNGLTAPSRVKELMAFMQKERDSIVKNAADSTRQWSAVASALAATENMDCLDLFIQLDGLDFISAWLKYAQKFNDGTVDSFVDEPITHLLRTLEKLDVDYEKLVALGIWATVQDLLVHNSSKVQDKARVLLESWKRKRESTASLSDADKTKALTDDEAGKNAETVRGRGHSESSIGDDSVSRATSVKEKGHELNRHDSASTSSDTVAHDQAQSAHNSDKIVTSPNGDERPLDPVCSASLPEPTMEPPLCHSIGTSSEPCNPAVSRPDTFDTPSEFHDSRGNTEQSPKSKNLPDKLESLEKSKMLGGRPFASSSDAVDEVKAIPQQSPLKNSIAGEKSSSGEGLSVIESRTIDSDVKGAGDDSSGANQFGSSSSYIAKKRGDMNSMLLKSSVNERSWGNHKNLGTHLSGKENDGKLKALGQRLGDNDLANNYSFSKRQMDRKSDPADKKSDVEIDYGIIDPLEVAMQVAMEVEREVVDNREQSCSSSEGNLRRRSSPGSRDSISGKQSQASEGSPKEVTDDPDLSNESSSTQEESTTSSENSDAEKSNGPQDVATSQVAEEAQEDTCTEKGVCKFDLNELCLEDSDRTGGIVLTPVSIVSASRAAAAPGMPGAPLQFEGNLGWKGSAVTSAFRPASPRRLPENGKDLSSGGSSSSSKQRQGFLDFDLNVTETTDAKIGGLSPDKHAEVYCSLPSGESSVELNSRRSEHLELDLNHASEDGGGGAMSDWRIGQFFPQGASYHSRSFSSSSSKQPIRNIDLNDQPLFLNDSSQSYLSKVSQNLNVSGGGIKSDDSVISIMGTRVEVNRKDFISQTHHLPNGRTPELAFDVKLGRTGNPIGIGSAFPYAHPPMYGYSNIAPGHAMSFPSTVYGSAGPIPYMVDSRGAPVIPHIMGSAAGLPTAFSQPPFLINMSSSNLSNGVGQSSRGSFDLNSGMFAESGSKDPAGFGLYLNSTNVRSMDDQLRSNSQSTVNSVVNGKRKEPDNGFEHYPFKHYIPPWKQS